MQGNIQYHKLKKAPSLEQVRNELRERRLSYDPTKNWTALLKTLKTHEQDKMYFTPHTDCHQFKWNIMLFNIDGEDI